MFVLVVVRKSLSRGIGSMERVANLLLFSMEQMDADA